MPLPPGIERENADLGHSSNCAFGAGGDCTCGKWVVEELTGLWEEEYSISPAKKCEGEEMGEKSTVEEKDDIPF